MTLEHPIKSEINNEQAERKRSVWKGSRKERKGKKKKKEEETGEAEEVEEGELKEW